MGESVQVFKVALGVRIVVVVCGALLAWLATPYDSGVILDKSSHGEPAAADALVGTVLGPFGNWDAVYFLHIAQYGYEYEMFHAFFPGVPGALVLVRSVGVSPVESLLHVSTFSCLSSSLSDTILWPLEVSHVLSRRSVLLVAGVLFS
jgi:GPI mannosyltransferase 2